MTSRFRCNIQHLPVRLKTRSISEYKTNMLWILTIPCNIWLLSSSIPNMQHCPPPKTQTCLEKQIPSIFLPRAVSSLKHITRGRTASSQKLSLSDDKTDPPVWSSTRLRQDGVSVSVRFGSWQLAGAGAVSMVKRVRWGWNVELSVSVLER